MVKVSHECHTVGSTSECVKDYKKETIIPTRINIDDVSRMAPSSVLLFHEDCQICQMTIIPNYTKNHSQSNLKERLLLVVFHFHKNRLVCCLATISNTKKCSSQEVTAKRAMIRSPHSSRENSNVHRIQG